MPKGPGKEIAQIFLGYEREDLAKVETLYNKLEGAGYKPWMDKKDIHGGERWKLSVQRAVQESNFFLACVSKNTLDEKGYLKNEIKFALDRLEELKATDIYLIPVRLEQVELPEPLSDFQSVDLFEKDGWSRLGKAIESQGFPGIDKPPVPTESRWGVVQGARRAILELIGPTYVLDHTFHFLDWNSTFDELVAKPLGLRRGQQAIEFIRQLTNCTEVIERSKQVFGSGKDPLVDLELLHYDSKKYGIILFQKLAAQIADAQGVPAAWSVHLNVLVAEKTQELWEDIKARLEREVNWSRYAMSYDKLLLPFDDYVALLDLAVAMVGNARRCVDLGAGTGTATLKLLDADKRREVWAVESNEGMLEYLRSKIRAADEDRLTIVKEDVLRLEDLPQSYFDAAILINVLYTVEDRHACLEQVHRILRPGSTLALSTPHRETDVKKLFARMREVLEKKGLFESLKMNFEAAKLVHEKMTDLIHRDTKDDIRQMIEQAGFTIDDWRDGEYAGAVVVVKAIKK